MGAVGHGRWTTFPVFSLPVPRLTPGTPRDSGLTPTLCSAPPPGTPSRDVLLVSAIITISLSVTIVLCGICQWCQRKMVSARLPSRHSRHPGVPPVPPAGGNSRCQGSSRAEAAPRSCRLQLLFGLFRTC